jgi:hypothetical protein
MGSIDVVYILHTNDQDGGHRNSGPAGYNHTAAHGAAPSSTTDYDDPANCRTDDI